MCGIVGIVSNRAVNTDLYDALTVLQHRGQDAAGLMTSDGEKFHIRRGNGLVRDVVYERHMRYLTGSIGIGHVRYPTAGSLSALEAQPFYTNSPYGIGLVHNGNLTNARELRSLLFREDRRHLNTDSDSEVLLNVLAHELQESARDELEAEQVFAAIRRVHSRCRGAYSAIALIAGVGLVAFRDPNGIRPLVIGRRPVPGGEAYMVASESVALDVLGFERMRDVIPGEAILISPSGELDARICSGLSEYHPCLFEYVYLARPDSRMEGISVHQARLAMGEYLAAKIRRDRVDWPVDVVIPIPDTSRMSALQLANRLGLEYREGFIKNRYIGRTFIMPEQKSRERSVRRKLNVIDVEFRDKNVLLVDDSIVRGTTSRQIVELAREAGARRVFFASAAPPVRFPNVYGIDMPSSEELVAAGRSTETIGQLIGADGLIYQELPDLIAAVRSGNPRIERFEDSCFSGDYVAGDVTPEYLRELSSERSALRREEQVAELDLRFEEERL
ncbi:MAG: amidophosphoribosyltransferase [Gammaproteobacteria bacterium]